jgi:catechol 1,2-dioxygenase
MIIETQEDVTRAVLAEMHRTEDARARELLELLVKHLHAFVREARLTEREFQAAAALVNAIGQRTSPSHNEAMLMAGALGVSNLVCLLNNGAMGTRPTQANNLGPFFRDYAPRCANGDSLVRSPTPGEPLEFTGRVEDDGGRPVADAEVHVWHSSPVGLYENQDPAQAGQFGVTRALIGRYDRRADGTHTLAFTSVLEPGEARMPRAPITGKAGAP